MLGVARHRGVVALDRVLGQGVFDLLARLRVVLRQAGEGALPAVGVVQLHRADYGVAALEAHGHLAGGRADPFLDNRHVDLRRAGVGHGEAALRVAGDAGLVALDRVLFDGVFDFRAGGVVLRQALEGGLPAVGLVELDRLAGVGAACEQAHGRLVGGRADPLLLDGDVHGCRAGVGDGEAALRVAGDRGVVALDGLLGHGVLDLLARLGVVLRQAGEGALPAVGVAELERADYGVAALEAHGDLAGRGAHPLLGDGHVDLRRRGVGDGEAALRVAGDRGVVALDRVLGHGVFDLGAGGVTPRQIGEGALPVIALAQGNRVDDGFAILKIDCDFFRMGDFGILPNFLNRNADVLGLADDDTAVGADAASVRSLVAGYRQRGLTTAKVVNLVTHNRFKRDIRRGIGERQRLAVVATLSEARDIGIRGCNSTVRVEQPAIPVPKNLAATRSAIGKRQLIFSAFRAGKHHVVASFVRLVPGN